MQVMGVVVRLAETIEVNGVVAGGKDHVLAVFRALDEVEKLRQSPTAGSRNIVMGLDRDYDSLAGREVVSPHVIYTNAMDAEAEILINGDVVRAASSAYSLPVRECALALRSGADLAGELASLWFEWISFGIAADLCGVGCEVKHSKHSRINSEGYGPLRKEAADELRLKIGAAVAKTGLAETFEAVIDKAAETLSCGKPERLVRGKWVMHYVWHLVRCDPNLAAPERNVRADTVVKTCLETLDFGEPWMRHYRTRLLAAIAA
ncbi:MAG: hypothetical protein L0H96_01050 [Humibacillus sp.]|nr:hypothetical protein [Humibacillus sp.]MDN5775484.1 hypothetical protein [Humibacillus sp.]